jgi:magnesium-transporting ATPase (P-type)
MYLSSSLTTPTSVGGLKYMVEKKNRRNKMNKKLFVILLVVAVVLGVVLGGISKFSGIEFSPLIIVGAPLAVVAIGEAVGTAMGKNKKK